MKTLLLFLAAGLLSGAAIASDPDAIIGIWMNHSGKGKIQIYREGNKYYGKVIWLKEPNNAQGTPKLDVKNPDKTRQSRPILGAVILRDFVYEDGEWSGGHVYDPASGKEYRCIMKMKNSNTLSVRGYIGISMFGRSEEWKRVSE